MGRKPGTGKKLREVLADYPELAAQLHPTKNGGADPLEILSRHNLRLHWICHEGKWPDGSPASDHEWEAFLYNRLAGWGCPCCSRQKLVASNCLAATHPEIAAQWHPTKNGSLTPDDVAAGSDRKVWWICHEGKWPDGSPASDHEWEAPIASRTIRGYLCKCCTGHKAVPSNCLSTTHPHLVAQWHPTKNGALTPFDVTAGSNKKVWWICHEGKWPDGSPALDHEWEATVASRALIHYGCPCCRRKTIVPSNCLTATHPEIASQWHPAKNGSLTPDDVAAGSGSRAWFLCAVGHEWRAIIGSRTSAGNGCPKCRASKGEAAISAYLDEQRLQYTTQWNVKGSGLGQHRFDFMVNRWGKEWLIEYHGIQHYSPHDFGSKKRRAKSGKFLEYAKRDGFKAKWAAKHKIPLLVIPYWDLDRLEQILDEFFFLELPPSFSNAPASANKYDDIRRRMMASSKAP